MNRFFFLSEYFLCDAFELIKFALVMEFIRNDKLISSNEEFVDDIYFINKPFRIKMSLPFCVFHRYRTLPPFITVIKTS